MARILLLSLYDRNAYGLRLMSANLKRHGHECHLVFVKRYETRHSYRLDLEVGEYPWQGISKSGRVFKYASNSRITDHELELLRQLVAEIEPDVVGTTVNTPLRAQSNRVTRLLKERLTAPVIWGGYDPTVNARDCVELCDYACIGEGDQTILDIAAHVDEGQPLDDINNLAYMREGEMVVNVKHPAEQDLDNYPWRDNSPQNKYLIEDNRLIRDYPVTTDKPPGVYQAMSSRGCPYKCSYCCEATFKELYSGEAFLRRRSPQDLVAEIAATKREFGLEQINFEDEIFAMHIKWLEEFAPLYEEHVDLPFTAYIYPTRNIEKILTLLRSVGLNHACLALESGSERINKKVFQRVYDRDLFLHTAEVCTRLGIEFYTDVITYNPYEEEQDLIDTLDVLLDIDATFGMCVNKLFVLPGTRMAQQMEQDGKVIADSATDPMFNYYCRLYWIASLIRRPRPLVSAIQQAKIFRRYARLLNPAAIEFVVNPVGGFCWLLRHHLPRRGAESVRWGARKFNAVFRRGTRRRMAKQQ